MVPIAEELDKVGFYSVEMWGGATFDVAHRYLGEDPWESMILEGHRLRDLLCTKHLLPHPNPRIFILSLVLTHPLGPFSVGRSTRNS